jgi:predicted metalloprotease
MLAASCTVTSSVTTERADEIVSPEDDATFVPVPGTDPAPPGDPAPDDPPPDDPPDDPTGTVPDVTDPVPDSTIPKPLEFDLDAIDFGTDKSARDYDEFLLAALTDLEAWWATAFPALYGATFDPLEGNVYAAYPERPDDIPGCGTPRTTYDDVREFVAFYCGIGDFMVYDDGSDGLLFELADNFGPATIGIVLAHEYGHAIQQRSGALTRSLPTVTTEQQADCFAGAWAGRAARGESPGLSFTDLDVRAGLIAMIKVEDPLGINQLTPGGHGSGFDRVGAFQVGFQEGEAQCADLLDNPLPLTPNQFRDIDERRTGGDAAFGYGENELLGFIPADLNSYWDIELQATITEFGALTLLSASSAQEVTCDQLAGRFDLGAGICVETGVVYINEPEALELYDDVGDFAIGYVLGVSWAEAVQVAVGSTLTGEDRVLNSDCLTGAWVKTVIPETTGLLPQPRPEERTVSVSPGDLTEAIQTVILIGDIGSADDQLGTAFEKIAAFRDGVLGGLEACVL